MSQSLLNNVLRDAEGPLFYRGSKSSLLLFLPPSLLYRFQFSVGRYRSKVPSHFHRAFLIPKTTTAEQTLWQTNKQPCKNCKLCFRKRFPYRFKLTGKIINAKKSQGEKGALYFYLVSKKVIKQTKKLLFYIYIFVDVCVNLRVSELQGVFICYICI